MSAGRGERLALKRRPSLGASVTPLSGPANTLLGPPVLNEPANLQEWDGGPGRTPAQPCRPCHPYNPVTLTTLDSWGQEGN